MASSPSQYAVLRRQLLTLALSECTAGLGAPTALFAAGDFNFRLDSKKLLGATGCAADRVDAKLFRCEFVRQHVAGQRLLEWDAEAGECFASPWTEVGWLVRWLVGWLVDWLEQAPITFRPTYRLDATGAYDDKRCPSWPDRVFARTEVPLLDVAYRAHVWGADHALVYLACSIGAAAQPAE